jgi:hypothetical protein
MRSAQPVAANAVTRTSAPRIRKEKRNFFSLFFYFFSDNLGRAMFIRELQRSWGFGSASAPPWGIPPTREQRKQFQKQLPESFRDIVADVDALQG